MTGAEGAFANLVVIGAMKCGTSALHHALEQHPDIAMSCPKELNFFFTPDAADVPAGVDDRSSDPAAWTPGNWQRGPTWYARQFPSVAPVRGESSPGYTSPAHPDVAARMAATIPDVRLVYLIRDPIERALSQYRHHRAEGTESRSLETALLDADSQYVTRGRYHERLEPFLEHFPRHQICIVTQEELLARRKATLDTVFRFVGVASGRFAHDACRRHRWNVSHQTGPQLDPRLRARLEAAFRHDTQRLRRLLAGSPAGRSHDASVRPIQVRRTKSAEVGLPASVAD